ncbi:hypothetical protein EYC84_002790 [Monilinia fructicola]|uniref:Uncharacterized protein n=1 Tax=Monilinia fructicola TaxID=38448 RepID=A0A5M9JRV4_MONFR|nr:hypothetical protein EYC84_002790 [Monilinia fructicola]
MAARLHRDGIWMRDDKEVNSKKKNKALGTVVENKTELNLYHENDKLGLVARDQTEAANDPECDTSSPAVEDDEELDLYDESSSPQGTSEETSGGMPEEGETSEKRPKTRGFVELGNQILGNWVVAPSENDHGDYLIPRVEILICSAFIALCQVLAIYMMHATPWITNLTRSRYISFLPSIKYHNLPLASQTRP